MDERVKDRGILCNGLRRLKRYENLLFSSDYVYEKTRPSASTIMMHLLKDPLCCPMQSVVGKFKGDIEAWGTYIRW